MKLWVVSDLHVDVNKRYPLSLPYPLPDHDILVIAGDICHGLSTGVDWIAAHGLNRKPVIYVAGNHEYYSCDFHDTLAAGRTKAAQTPNVHLLDRDAVQIGGVTFLGCTLWTDYKYFGPQQQARSMYEVSQGLNDHRQIKMGTGPWTPEHALKEHEASRQWLRDQLARASRRSTVVVTHHAPSRNSVQPNYRNDPMTAAFASDAGELVSQAALWIHGHLHAPSDSEQDGCRILANPRGYVGIREDRRFEPDLVVEVPGGR